MPGALRTRARTGVAPSEPAGRGRAPSWVDRRFQRAAFALAALATAHALLYWPFVGKHIVTDSASYIAGANALLDGGYTTPLKAGFYYTYPVGFFDLSGVEVFDRSVWDAPERQAFRPPGYPAFLALVGGGDDEISRDLAFVSQALLFGAGALLLALAARRWWGPRLALAAVGLYALDPYSKHYVTLVMSETVAGFLLLTGLYALTRAWQERSPLWWAATAALAAALTLVRAVFVFAVPLVVVAALLLSAPMRERLRNGAVAAACAAALLVPWLAWTTHVSGRTVFANWGEGYNFLLAAYGEGHGRTATDISGDVDADVAGDPAFLVDLASAHRVFPSRAALVSDPEAHPRYLARADALIRERAFDRFGERLGSEPLQVAWETLYRAWFLWSAHKDWYQPGGLVLALMVALDWIVLALAALGATLALVHGGAPRAAALFLLAYTAVLGTHHVEARFAMPVRGVLLAFAVFAVAALATQVREFRRP